MTNSMLIKQLEETKCSPSEITHLKRQYELVINSRRTFERIDNIKDLLKVLIKRDELNDDVVKDISKILQKSSVPQNSQTQAPSVTARQVLQQIVPQPALPTTYSVYQPEFTKEEQFELVYSKICEDIGSHWRDFARGLDIKESIIDDLQENQKSTAERVRKILNLHQNQCDPNQWRKNLLGALQKARRNDLRREVESMLDRFKIILPKP